MWSTGLACGSSTTLIQQDLHCPMPISESVRTVSRKHLTIYWWKQSDRLYKIKPYEYPRRHEDEGGQMLAYLNTLYNDRDSWEARRDSLRREVRERLAIDALLDSCVKGKPILSKIRKYDGYTVQNICLETTPGQHVFGSIYTPSKKGKHALIICPGGHFNQGRYRKDQQQRMGTLARMGAICVDFDLYGGTGIAD